MNSFDQIDISPITPCNPPEIPDDAFSPGEIVAEKIDELSEIIKTPLERQIQAIESIADSARQQAELAKVAAAKAEEDARIAKRDAVFSKTIAIISLLISIAAIALPLIYG